MGSRSSTLADRLEDSADAIITMVEDLSDADWVKVATEDGRQINVIVHHIAQSHEAVYMLVDMILAGQPLPPITPEMIQAGNAQHAEENADVSKETALVALRLVAESTGAKLRAMDDSDLDKSAEFTLSPSGSISIDGIVSHIMIDHADGHLESIRAAIG